MSDKDIFDSGSTKPVTPAANTTAQGDDTSSPVAILVGEGRKYKTIEELAKAYLHIDEFTEKLKSENSTLREELAKASTLDEVLKQLKAPAPGAATDKAVDTTPKGLTEKDVASIVSNILTGRETTQAREGNLKKADAAMKTLFGDKAKEVFDKEATTPELRASLIQLASLSPEKFVALFTPASKATGGQVDSKTVVNTAALNDGNLTGRAADEGCKEYYDALRRKEPAKYYSQAVQLKIHQAAMTNPEKYFGRKV